MPKIAYGKITKENVAANTNFVCYIDYTDAGFTSTPKIIITPIYPGYGVLANGVYVSPDSTATTGIFYSTNTTSSAKSVEFNWLAIGT